MTEYYTGVAATDPIYELGEGVLWDDAAGLIRWVDIQRGLVLSGVPTGGKITQIHEVAIGQTAGAVALAEDGGLLIAAARGLATISTAGDLSFGPDLLGERRGVRFNDGSADSFGAFVVGTLALEGGSGTEVLLRVWPNGRIDTLRENIGLSNGIAFSPNGETIYHVDTIAGTISSHSYGSATFDLNEPWTTVLEHLPAAPDGLVVDAEGALWVAQWGGSSVRRYSPAGELLAVVEVDATQASCPGFVGESLNTLAITTAQIGLNGGLRLDGAVFLANVGVAGMPSHRWAGSTTTPYWLNDNRKGPE